MDILIIEDETLAADKLEQMILRHDASHQILAKIRSVEAATKWFAQNTPPDVLFLDIHLLDGTSFDILKTNTIDCPVIFTTAYDAYALDAFQLHSIDYLLKPISFAKLHQAFQKLNAIQQTFQKAQQTQQLDKVLSAIENQSQHYKSRFLVKFRTQLLPIAVEQISYFFSEDRITFLVTKEGKKHIINHSLDELETLVDPANFFRINRQMIVHIESIQAVHKYFKGRLKVELSPAPDAEAIVSSRRIADFQVWLDG